MDSMSYDYEIANIRTGANYGNIEIFSRCDSLSNLAGLWSAKDDQFYCGKWVFKYTTNDHHIKPVKTIFRATNQTTIYHEDNTEIQQTYFVPLNTQEPQTAYMIVRFRNYDESAKTVHIETSLQFPWFMWPEFTKLPDMSQKNKRTRTYIDDNLIITETVDRPEEVRIIGTPLIAQEHRFDNTTASLRYSINLEPKSECEFPFIMAISNTGVHEALARYERGKDYNKALDTTNKAMEEMLSVSDILVPDPVINRAIKWAKVNMIREEKLYPNGYGFTNDPPQDILVVRDYAWFSIGSDYITPWFSQGMTKLIQQYGVEESGALTEYLLACETPPYKSNYGLNINDDTPLFIFAVYHHFALTGEQKFLEELYPTVKDAAENILSQKRGGLIWCTSEESNAWGIASWRNMIPEYQISGAVLEINAECYMALRLAGRCASAMGEEERAKKYFEEARQLRDEINRQMISEITGLYVLNIDNNGTKHHDITGDQIFAVMFGVADEEMRKRILNVLYSPDFWTDFGVRTVGKNEPDYDPEFAMRLMGGIWPNLTAWVAYASRLNYPEKTVEAMRNIYRISEVSTPVSYRNVVPGTFPECLNGESFQSRGMAQSPWVAPTFLWLAIDGLLGMRSDTNELRVRPHLPEQWQWCAIRNIPYRGGRLSYFFHNGTIYINHPVNTGYPVELYDTDITEEIECNSYCIALQRRDEIAIFAGTSERQGVVLKVKPPLVREEQRFEFLLNPGDIQIIKIPAIQEDLEEVSIEGEERMKA